MTVIAWLAIVVRLLVFPGGPGTQVREQAAPSKPRSAAGADKPGATPRFEKVSDHVYFLEAKGEGVNTSAVVSAEGFLLVDPPGEPALQPALDALRRIAARPVRWVVNTDYRQERKGGGLTMLSRGAALIAAKELRDLFPAAPAQDVKEPAGERKGTGAAEEARPEAGPRLTFTRQMRLFPDNLEIRVIAVQHRARTSGDVLVFIPAEKVLITGELFVSGRFPDIDVEAGGSVSGWIDGLKQAVDSVPLLKSAMPQPKPDPTKPPPEEKTLEEQVTVIPGRGPRSNLQEMKDLLEAALKLRTEMTRAIGSGRSRESILNSGALGPARFLDNFDSFSAQLLDELLASKVK